MPQRQQIPDVISAIFKATSDPNTRTAMVFGSGLESRWVNTAQNPSGATGPYQILLPVHPDITQQQAEDPAYATHYMLSAYEQAVNQVNPQLWVNNPELAAEQVAILAEQPGGSYPQTTPGPYGSEDVNTVNQVWGEASNLLSGRGLNTATLTAATSASGQDSSYDPVTFAYDQGRIGAAIVSGNIPAFFNAVGATWNSAPSSYKSMFINVGIILFGLIVVLIGLSHAFNVHPIRIARKTAGTVAEIAGTATGQPEVAAAGATAKGARRGK